MAELLLVAEVVEHVLASSRRGGHIQLAVTSQQRREHPYQGMVSPYQGTVSPYPRGGAPQICRSSACMANSSRNTSPVNPRAV